MDKNINLHYQSALYQLLQSEPVYAYFIINCQVHLNSSQSPTAHVQVSNGGIAMHFNPEWIFQNAPHPRQFAAVIKHEILHLLFLHLAKSRWTDLFNKYQHLKIDMYKVLNVAMDCVINQEIDNLPDGCITLEGLEKITGKQLLRKQTTEYYFEELMQKAEDLISKMPDNWDDHDWGDCDGDGLFKVTAPIKNALDKAVKQSHGNIPSAVQKALEALADLSKVPWQVFLQQLIAHTTTVERLSTRMKVNRRYGTEFPGFKRKKKLKVALMVDESGSMSDDDIQLIANEVMALLPKTGEMHVIHADCVVAEVDEVKPNEEYKFVRKAGGGTAYQPAIDKASELEVDLMIYAGDMDCADTPTNPGVPFLWLTVRGGNPPADFGELYKI